MNPSEDLESDLSDVIAALQRVPAPALDAEKHETLRESTDSLTSLERAFTNEVSQLRERDDDE